MKYIHSFLEKILTKSNWAIFYYKSKGSNKAFQMNCLYWNIRGIANSPSRLALKNHITSQRPHFIFIAEPWILFEQFPRNWFQRLHYKIFATNTKHNLIPNLWCLCVDSLNPNLLASDDQQVTFSISENNIHIYISAVYASTNYVHRSQFKFLHMWMLH